MPNPNRLNFKTYLRFIENSVGSNSYRNFYMRSDEGEFDSLDDGQNSCAFFASSVLVIFNKMKAVHGTVAVTLDDLKQSSWREVSEPEPGDVLLWEPVKQADGRVRMHLGFYMGDGQAISNSATKRVPAKHDMNFGEENRKIIQIFRMDSWDDQP